MCDDVVLFSCDDSDHLDGHCQVHDEYLINGRCLSGDQAEAREEQRAFAASMRP
jgi:hypothetical protein